MSIEVDQLTEFEFNDMVEVFKLLSLWSKEQDPQADALELETDVSN